MGRAVPQINNERIPINLNNQNIPRPQYRPEPERSQNIKTWARENINPKTVFGILGIICLLALIVPILTIFYAFCHWLVSDHKMIAHIIVAIIVALNVLVRL